MCNVVNDTLNKVVHKSFYLNGRAFDVLLNEFKTLNILQLK